MTIDKKISYEVQGGAKNYLGKQKEVTAPIKWKSSPDSPETELAYITKAEKDLLVKKDIHGSLKGDVNRGPSGIMSLDGYGSFDSDDPSRDTGMSGVATSAAEAGGGSGADRRELDSYIDYGFSPELPPGTERKLPQDIQDYRNAFIAAGGGQRVNPGFFDSRFTVSPEEIRSAKDYVKNRSRFKSKSLNPGIAGFFTSGGLLGNIIRNIGQKFGFGKRYNEPTYDMRGLNTRVYENILGPSTNPNPLDIYNDLVTDDSDEDKKIGTFNTATFDDDVNLTGGGYRGIPGVNYIRKFPIVKSGGTVLADEFPSTEIDYGNPTGDFRIPSEEMGLVGDLGIMSVAEKPVDNRTLLEKILNPDLKIDEALEKEDEKRRREEELLQEIMPTMTT